MTGYQSSLFTNFFTDPDVDWPADFPDACAGTSQSPINIDTDNVELLRSREGLSFSIGYKILQTGPLINNGHSCMVYQYFLHTHTFPRQTLSLSVKYSADESYGASVSGGPLNGSYTLNQFHLHWGSVHGQGSEHTVNGFRLVENLAFSNKKKETLQLPILMKLLFREDIFDLFYFSFDAELHFVHYNSKFDNISAAVASGESDALAVVGILIQEASPWDQYVSGKAPESDSMLMKGALELSRPWRGPTGPSVELEVIPDQFISEIT